MRQDDADESTAALLGAAGRASSRLEASSSDRYDPEELRSLIGVVPQDIHLFNGTLADNLRVADPDAELDRLEGALAKVALSGIVATRRDGFDAIVGENGLLLSGGERQRLAVARMLLKDAPFFIMDEPTANLDVETEQRLVQSLQHELAGKTGLIMTHRPAVCALADEVVEMAPAESPVAHEL